jgi:hypothetical protein
MKDCPAQVSALHRTAIPEIGHHGQLDPAKATAWGFVRTVDYWLWGLGKRTHQRPLRCQRIADALAPAAEQSNLPRKH